MNHRTPVVLLSLLATLFWLAPGCSKKSSDETQKGASKDPMVSSMGSMAPRGPAERRTAAARPAPARRTAADAMGAGDARPVAVKLHHHVSKKGRYEILLFGPPKIKVQSVPTLAGNLTVTFAMSEKKGGGCGLKLGCMAAAAFNDMPAAVVKKTPVDKLLDGARDGALKNSGSTLISEKKITLGKHPGRELKMKRSFGPGEANLMINRARMFLVGNRLYQVQVIAMKPFAELPAIQQILDSFKLTK